MNSFFIWHIFLGVGKTQDLPSRIWQTLEDEVGDSVSLIVCIASARGLRFHCVMCSYSSTKKYR
jgi:hypothetical protein